VEALRAELESTRVSTEDVRYEAALRGARGRLNALLRRPLDAPLAAPLRLRALPAPGVLDVTRLVQRMRTTSPTLAADAAAVAGADANRRLAEKSWYPDVTLGAAAIDRTGNGPNGYQAWVSVKVPLQWGRTTRRPARPPRTRMPPVRARRFASSRSKTTWRRPLPICRVAELTPTSFAANLYRARKP
jgi:outer membrane protein TolC